jgi:hypothetical protein
MEPGTTTTADPPPIENRAAINVESRGIAKVAGLPQTWTDSQIDAGATIEGARAAAFAAMQARSAAADSIRTATAGVSGHDANDPEWRIRTIGEAIHCRMSGTAPSDAARPYAELTLLEIAKDCLRARGLSTTGNPAQVMERSLISMSDLPALMSDAINRSPGVHRRAKRLEADRPPNNGAGLSHNAPHPTERGGDLALGQRIRRIPFEPFD